jgi:hypothetical protein
MTPYNKALLLQLFPTTYPLLKHEARFSELFLKAQADWQAEIGVQFEELKVAHLKMAR